MKTKIIMGTVLVSIVLFTGCSNKSPSTPQEAKKQEVAGQTKELPSWVQNPKVDNAICAVGIANYSKHGIPAMLPIAQMDARAKLAGKVQTIVSQLKQRAIRKTKLNNIDEFETSFKEVTKEVIKEIPISGAKRVKMYQAKDGTLYILMIIEKKEITQNLKDIKSMYEAKQSKEYLNEGMKVIDNMIEELNKEVE